MTGTTKFIRIKVFSDRNYVEFKEIRIEGEKINCEFAVKKLCAETIKVKMISFLLFGIKEQNKNYDIWVPLNEILRSDKTYEFRIRFRVS